MNTPVYLGSAESSDNQLKLLKINQLHDFIKDEEVEELIHSIGNSGLLTQEGNKAFQELYFEISIMVTKIINFLEENSNEDKKKKETRSEINKALSEGEFTIKMEGGTPVDVTKFIQKNQTPEMQGIEDFNIQELDQFKFKYQQLKEL